MKGLHVALAVEDVLRRAKALRDLGRPDDADPMLAEVLAAEPDNEEALSLLGAGLFQRRRYQEAADVTEHLLRVSPDNLAGLLRMALLMRALRRPREGVPFARRALALDPDSPVGMMTLALILNAITHGSAEALALAGRAVSINPQDAMANWLISKIHLDDQRYAEAERWALAALRVDPANEQAILQLGLARAGLGRFDESRDEVLAALRLNATPMAIDEVISRIEVRGIPGHFAEIYRMALAARGQPDLSHPGAAGDDPELLAAQARLARRMYTWESGPDGWRRAGELAAAVLAAEPGNQDARYVRSLELSEAGQYEQALRIAEELRAEGYPHVNMPLLRARGGVRDFAGALAVARAALAEDPDQVQYLRCESFYLRKLGRYDEAWQSAQRAAQLNPAGRDVQLELGLAAKGTGDVAAAERALRAAVADAPGEGNPAAELAVLLAETGRWPEAEALIAAVPADVPDAREVATQCMRIAAEAIGRAQPALDEIFGAGVPPTGAIGRARAALKRVFGARKPARGALEESAHWLRVAMRMWAAGVSRNPECGKLLISNGIAGTAAALRNVPVPEDSGFAHVVRDFDALVDSWRSDD